MQLPGRVALLLCCCWTTLGRGSSASDPWAQCKNKSCESKFANEVCDKDCTEPECLRDGLDCITDKGQCKQGHVEYCKHHYDNSHCDQGCNNALCGWDGSDCYHDPIWATGSLIVQTRIPFTQGPFQNNSLLWTLSTLLRTPVKLRDRAPFKPSSDLHRLQPQQLADLLKPTAPVSSSEGSLLFLQVDNKPCVQQQEASCFPSAPSAARFLQARMAPGRIPSGRLAEVQAIVHVRGVMEELGDRSEEGVEAKTGGKRGGNRDAAPAWLWPVVGAGVGLGLAVVVAVVLVVMWVRRRRRERAGESDRVRHRSTGTDNGKNNNGSKAWIETASHRGERGKDRREKEKNGLKKKKGKGKDTGKKRREPLGEDAIRLRPLRKDLDIGSDTDMTQSSMEDVRYARREEICDHRTPEQKNFRLLPSRPQSLSPMQAPPGGWERNSTPSHQRSQTPTNTASVQWCGPDGSVVLIRAVRSGLDRVVLELLRAGVPVNNTDHTGRSALHWACTVNHLSLARTLIRYGAAVDLQDNKGETALFLSALHGCYDTARFLLLNGANQDLCDRHGRRPVHVAREGMHHQVLELLLAHRVQRGPVPIDPACEVLWDDRAYLYSPWAAPPSLPSRSASFSGAITPRGLSSPPPPSDWSMGPRQCPSPQNWRPSPSQSTTALVTPRILGLPPRPISTLQEVTSEAEEEEREAARDREGPRAVTPHFLSPQPAPRQRSFSCTQHALQRRSGCNPAELSLHVPTPTEKAANEHIERVISPPPKEAPNQLENKGSIPVPPKPQIDPEREISTKNCNQKSEKANHENLTSVQSAL
ncbi:neurogenic locus notch homolog protein 1 isoform X1 [Alosa sapidissima]|uniref:neurogenic locus notch homolog protein 1 isoform X1 n=1 Tax=Alosa sapidissima TaxID=34773 RepID=UPI001C08D129|nr:neurogenic locus notch homolog protein 1 isoform X1 [Alosa sapidissima]